jgi:hypothetical protein
VEALEDVRQLTPLDPWPVVDDLELRDRRPGAGLRAHPHADARAGRRVRKSVVEQDSQDLPDSLGVADGLDVTGRAGAHDLECVRALRGGSRELVGDLVGERTQWHGLALEIEGAGIQA